MITANELLKDLQKTKKKAELIETTYPGNDIWKDVNSKLSELINFINSDKRMYRW